MPCLYLSVLIVFRTFWDSGTRQSGVSAGHRSRYKTQLQRLWEREAILLFSAKACTQWPAAERGLLISSFWTVLSHQMKELLILWFRDMLLLFTVLVYFIYSADTFLKVEGFYGIECSLSLSSRIQFAFFSLEAVGIVPWIFKIIFISFLYSLHFIYSVIYSLVNFLYINKQMQCYYV